MKGQLLFRECGVASHGLSLLAGIGIMENRGGTIERERFQDFLLFDDSISLTGESRRIDIDYETSDLDPILRSKSFKAPSEVTGLSGGSMIFRQTNAPAEVSPNKVDLVVLAMRCDAKLFDHKTIYEINSDKNGRLNLKASHKVDFEPNGMALGQIHKKPIWGWGTEKHGPVSTMRLDIAAQCQKCVEHLVEGKEIPEDIPYDIRAIVDPAHRDKDFILYRNEMHKRKALRPWTEWLSESQDAEISKQGSEVIKAILAKAA